MNEQDWLTSTSMRSLFLMLQRESIPTDRKLRLLACSCCRTISHLLLDEGVRSIDISESFADGKSTLDELARAREQAKTPYMAGGNGMYGRDAGTRLALRASVMIAWGKTNSERAAHDSVFQLLEARRFSSWKNADVEFSGILRDIFGNPFRPVILDRRWQTSTVPDLALTIYDERAFDRLPFLADALMDAGCDSDEILNHCRSPGPHVRGCWVVDLVTGKE